MEVSYGWGGILMKKAADFIHIFVKKLEMVRKHDFRMSDGWVSGV